MQMYIIRQINCFYRLINIFYMYHQLKSFLAIAELKSVSMAAKRIHLTQPALTQHVRFLEELFGIRLIVRSGNTMELTPEGIKLRDIADPLVVGMDGLKTALTTNGEKSSVVRFATIDSVTHSILAGAIRKILATEPSIQLIPSVEASGMAVQHLLAGTIDLALITLDNLPRSLGNELLFHERLVFIGSPAHRSLRKDRLVNLPFILFPQSSMTRSLVDEAMAKQRIVPNILLETIKVSAIVAFVEAGLGISIVPNYSVLRDIQLGRIVELPIRTSVKRRVGVAFRKDRPLSSSTINFIQCLRAEKRNIKGNHD
ncbi:MAG: hypothetical protein COX62_07530 [Deltaproteobacteria bacterium CG_4_10_14_0_2_um_filter_43_8]|nr:MAG: hypothetical protein COV46_03330 [Deltaproteobacteria bacterium CG11_big_fil_rev_8_21_14_0_20_49_13]PJA19013.1 MAG: hypothetical protein COX62_07530 [Deltaproteobacteria bacterium CG_4_10_14_0_2_um_filter_43_8]